MPLNAGLDLSQFTDHARRGMRSPAVVTLRAGEALFRFASTARHDGTSIPSNTWAASPWWMYEADYHAILAVHRQSQAAHGRNGQTLGMVARGAMAIQQSWSRLDVRIKAVVLQDINAFLGLGRTQYRELAPNGMYFTLPGWPDVRQLYIPNISDRTGLTPLFRQALDVRTQKIVSSQQLY